MILLQNLLELSLMEKRATKAQSFTVKVTAKTTTKVLSVFTMFSHPYGNGPSWPQIIPPSGYWLSNLGIQLTQKTGRPEIYFAR